MSNGPVSKGRKKSAFSDFLKKNKSLAFSIPILLIGIVVVVVMYSKPQSKPKPAAGNTVQDTKTPGGKDLQVEVLPQMERVKQPEDLNLSGFNDPFGTNESSESSIYLKGIVLSDKSDTAIIETNSRAYIVSVGDSVDTYWVVEKIEDKRVTLKDKNGNDLVLTLN